MGLNVLFVQYPRTVTISTTGRDGKNSKADGGKDDARKSVGPVGKARAALEALTGKDADACALPLR